MEKFTVTIIRTDEYEVHIDETVWTPEELKSWSKVFFDAPTPKEFAEYLAGAVMREGSGQGFMEGFGNVKQLNSNGDLKRQSGKDWKPLTEDEYTKGLLVRIVSEDSDYDFDTTKL